MTAPQSWVWDGSSFVPCNGIPISDRGFRYGMALFESLAIRGGKVEFLEAHLERLTTACRGCGWPVDPAVLACAGKQLSQGLDSMFARIYITAGEGGPVAPVTTPRIFLYVEPRESLPMQRLRVGLHREPFLPVLGGTKTTNYWGNIAALQNARETGEDEALLFNPHGCLISSCMANVFVEVEGRLMTPHLASGARAGVVREWVIQSREVVQSDLSREEVSQASACFLTSCWTGIAPVAVLDGRPLHTSLGETLHAEFFSRE